MKNNYIHKEKRSLFIRTIWIFSVLILTYAVIRTGFARWDVISKASSNIVQNIDVENFKNTINNSVPLINTIYNSGNISVSFSGEVKNIIKGIFGFDLSTPITIINSQSSVFYSYYTGPYQIAEEQKDEKPDVQIAENTSPPKVQNPTNEKASGITFEGVGENRNKAESHIDYDKNKKITIQNETKYRINVDELLSEPLKVKFDKKGPKVLIYHTHTTESYLDNLKNLQNKNARNRTDDPRYNVVRVGEELSQNLRKKYGIEVIHNATMHNYPSDIGAYGRSLNTASKILKSYPSIRVVLDIHRDGLGENTKLRAVSAINNKNTAQVMFVVGTNATGLEHPNWRENLKLAVKLQEKLNQQNFGFAKPIYISENRYNQHLALGSLIIEIGGDGNLLSESLESTKHIAKAINDVLNNK